MEQATLGALDLALAGPVEFAIQSGAGWFRFEPRILEPATETFELPGEPGGHRSANTIDVLELHLGAPDLRCFACACDLRAHLRSNLTLARALLLKRRSIEPLDADPDLLSRAYRLAERVGGPAAAVLGLYPRLPRPAVRSATVLQRGRKLWLRLERDTVPLQAADCMAVLGLPGSGIRTWWLEAEREFVSSALRLAERPV
jgi:hypothetical protein